MNQSFDVLNLIFDQIIVVYGVFDIKKYKLVIKNVRLFDLLYIIKVYLIFKNLEKSRNKGLSVIPIGTYT